MSYGSHGGELKETCRDSDEDALGEHELPVFFAETGHHQGEDVGDGRGADNLGLLGHGKDDRGRRDLPKRRIGQIKGLQ